jgi:hypothetical protein
VTHQQFNIQQLSPSIRKYPTPPGQWAKNDKEKAYLFAEHISEVFCPHNNDPDEEVEHELPTPIQSPKRLKAFTLQELKDVIKTLNQTKHQVTTLL